MVERTPRVELDSTPESAGVGLGDPRPEPIGWLGRLASLPAFWLVVVLTLFGAPLAAAWSRDEPLPDPPAPILTLPPFELTSEKGHPFGSEQLRGKVWVAGFMFTTCPVVCPKLTRQMVEIQHRTRNLGGAFHLVSFTVDPETDTPERLAAYGRQYRYSPGRWTFLTGNLDVIESTVVSGFKLAMGRDADSLFEIFHSERLVLVDREGTIRGYYDATDEGVAALVRDVGLVVNFG